MNAALGAAHRWRAPGRTWLVGLAALVTVAAVPLLAGLSLALRAGFSIRSCMPVSGWSGWLGAQFSLVHADSACPVGTMAAGPDEPVLLTVLGCVTVAAVLAHLGIAALVSGTIWRIRQLGRRLRTVLRPKYRCLPNPSDCIDQPALVKLPQVRRDRLRVPLPPYLTRPVWRGPPLLAA